MRSRDGRITSSSSLFVLVGEMVRVSMLDLPGPASLRASGVEGAAGDAARGWEAFGAPAWHLSLIAPSSVSFLV